MISKNMISSPLSCCIPTGERQNMNPVFKQQYITEGGHIKMKMPVSPMHYISNASFYAHDDRFPVRVEPGYPYYNERIHQNAWNMEYEIGSKNDGNKRIITPSMSFITQPRRNLSAQIIDNSQNNQGQISTNHILANINDKLTRIEFLCKNNEEDIKEIIHILKSKESNISDNINSNDINDNTNRNNINDNVNNKIIRNTKSGNNYNYNNNNKERDLNETFKYDRNKDVINNRENNEGKMLINPGNNISKLNIKYYETKDLNQMNEKLKERLLTHHSLLNSAPEIITKLDDKMFDISDDLKNSNDLLEKYLKNVKFDEDMSCLENRLDVLSADYAISNGINDYKNNNKDDQENLINNNIDKEIDEIDNDDSFMSNIESKFRKLFSRFDSNNTDESQNISDKEDENDNNSSNNINEKVNNNNKADIDVDRSRTRSKSRNLNNITRNNRNIINSSNISRNININNNNNRNQITNYDTNSNNDQNKESMVIFDGLSKLERNERYLNDTITRENNDNDRLNIINQDLSLSENDIFNTTNGNINVKLSNIDMINILKEIDLPSRIREANLTMDELIFLNQLNKHSDFITKDIFKSDKIKEEREIYKNNNITSKEKEEKENKSKLKKEQSEDNKTRAEDNRLEKEKEDETQSDDNYTDKLSSNSEDLLSIDTDHEFKCDLLAPTRVDFTPLLRDDSIHGLNSSTFD